MLARTGSSKSGSAFMRRILAMFFDSSPSIEQKIRILKHDNVTYKQAILYGNKIVVYKILRFPKLWFLSDITLFIYFQCHRNSNYNRSIRNDNNNMATSNAIKSFLSLCFLLSLFKGVVLFAVLFCRKVFPRRAADVPQKAQPQQEPHFPPIQRTTRT